MATAGGRMKSLARGRGGGASTVTDVRGVYVCTTLANFQGRLLVAGCLYVMTCYIVMNVSAICKASCEYC